MSLRDQFATNEKKETDGVPIRQASNADGTVPTFFVSRMGKSNKAYMTALERAIRPLQRRINNNTLPREESEAVLQDVFLKHVLKGWEHVKRADLTGNDEETGELPFSVANAKALFAALPDLYDDLTKAADDAANFRDVELEADAKN